MHVMYWKRSTVSILTIVNSLIRIKLGTFIFLNIKMSPLSTQCPTLTILIELYLCFTRKIATATDRRSLKGLVHRLENAENEKKSHEIQQTYFTYKCRHDTSSVPKKCAQTALECLITIEASHFCSYTVTNGVAFKNKLAIYVMQVT